MIQKTLKPGIRKKLNYLKKNFEADVYNDTPGGYILIVVKNKIPGFVGDHVIALNEVGIDNVIEKAKELQPINN